MRRHRTAWYLAAALLHVAVLTIQAPHLVHHAFERHAPAADECALAAAADHGQAAVDAESALHRPADAATAVVVRLADRPAPSALADGAPRAPPRLPA